MDIRYATSYSETMPLFLYFLLSPALLLAGTFEQNDRTTVSQYEKLTKYQMVATVPKVNCGRQIKISLGTSSLQKVAEILIVAQNNAQLCDLLLPRFFDFKCKIFAKLFLSRGKFAKIFIEIKEISKSRIECALRLIVPKRYVRGGKSIRSGWAVRLLLYFHPKNHGA